MNLELQKIYEIEKRFGSDCWTRTDDDFINDSSVQYVRTNKKKPQETYVTPQLISDLSKDLKNKRTVLQIAYKRGLTPSCVSTLIKTINIANSLKLESANI